MKKSADGEKKLQKIQASNLLRLTMGNSSHKSMPSTLCMGCFSYISVLKWCIHGTTPTTHSCWNIAHRYSSHKSIPIILSMECFSHTSRSHRDFPQQTYAQYILYGMFLLHIQGEIVPTRISSNKPVPSTILKGMSFSCMFRLKWCLRKPPTNLFPRRSLGFSYMPGWNRASRELLINE